MTDEEIIAVIDKYCKEGVRANGTTPRRIYSNSRVIKVVR
jgi:hypothetical protein